MLARKLDWTLLELRQLDLQTIADIRSILAHEGDIGAQMPRAKGG